MCANVAEVSPFTCLQVGNGGTLLRVHSAQKRLHEKTLTGKTSSGKPMAPGQEEGLGARLTGELGL